jgi:hypothetical protein
MLHHPLKKEGFAISDPLPAQKISGNPFGSLSLPLGKGKVVQRFQH